MLREKSSYRFAILAICWLAAGSILFNYSVIAACNHINKITWCFQGSHGFIFLITVINICYFCFHGRNTG